MQFLQNIFITPGEARLRSGWRLLAHFFLLLLLVPVVASIFTFLSTLSPLFAFLADYSFISLIALTLSVYLARRWYDQRSFRSLGLNWGVEASRDLLAGILIAAVLMGFIFFVEWAFGLLTFNGLALNNGPTGLAPSLGYWAAAFIMVGWYEELVFRGYWLQNLADGLGMNMALLISSAVFALAHVGNLNISSVAVVGLLVAGYFLAFGYLRTNQLWLPIGLHIGWNFFEGPIFSFPVSGLQSFRLLNVQVHGPELVTGGAFGPEAGLIILPAMALGAALIYLYSKKYHRQLDQVDK
jgi:hypothetical protein